MRIQFKATPHQTDAVESVLGCFDGQPWSRGNAHDPTLGGDFGIFPEMVGGGNGNLLLENERLLENIQEVQRKQGLPLSRTLWDFKRGDTDAPVEYVENSLRASNVHLDVEMETGTGKTYCYINTIFEMKKRFGWSKFIIMVPSLAIREGVRKSFELTTEHFWDAYGGKARVYVYDSSRLYELESFSTDANINVMIINIQAFNNESQNLRIHEELDAFQSRKPIDVIAATRPILIMDEPQRMEGPATLEALPKFKPLFILRYSATHRTSHNLVHRLDAIDAYDRRLVKKISVRGIQSRGMEGTGGFLYLAGIDTSKSEPVARMIMEFRTRSGEINRRSSRLRLRDDLFKKSNELNQYRGFKVSQIDAARGVVEFANGSSLESGEAIGDVTEGDVRHIQIREAIEAHLRKERQLYYMGVKVLSLFFIDEVSKYRDYERSDLKGEFARIFEREYDGAVKKLLSSLSQENTDYRNYLKSMKSSDSHSGYFSVDGKGRSVNGRTRRERDGENGNLAPSSQDVSAYDLILRNKERLLSFEESTRFIFSHSALREGWDNPNVFVICMLKTGNNAISRRQEIGRGLRLCVNKHGERIDQGADAHDINVLTVVAAESYANFVEGLQTEIFDTLSNRPQKAEESYFIDKIIWEGRKKIIIDQNAARAIHRYLIRNQYIDDQDQFTNKYHDHKVNGILAELPEPLSRYPEGVFGLIDSVIDATRIPRPENDRNAGTIERNENFHKKEFRLLWERINHKAIYFADFDSNDLVEKCVSSLDRHLQVTQPNYVIQHGDLNDLNAKDAEGYKESLPIDADIAHYFGKYDLIGKISSGCDLTRRTVIEILSSIEPSTFQKFKINPEQFISAATRIINEEKSSIIIEHIAYETIDNRYSAEIFTASQSGDISRMTGVLEKHVYDRALIDSEVERQFVLDIDRSDLISVYAKLPRGFTIPTPVGNYNPDWAISFKEKSVRHIYFVAETKGSDSSINLRKEEADKIQCARMFFSEIDKKYTATSVKYDVVKNFTQLMNIIRDLPVRNS